LVDAQALKVELGLRAKDIIADNLGLVENGSKKVICPLHNDTHPSMSWYKEGLMWRCHVCAGQIDIYTYYQNYEGMEFTEAVDKVNEIVGGRNIAHKPIVAKDVAFVLPDIKVKELDAPFIEYMAKRKITKDTLDYWRVKQYTWERKDSNGKTYQTTEVYVFQYYDEADKLIYVTYRGLGKGAIKGGCETNTKSILWGMWHIDKTKPVVITEGQPDAMVVWQSGYKNVVSAPGGASNLTWIDHNWKWLQDIPEFIVFADNDVNGQRMASKIKEKLKNVKVLTATEKDANEVLFYHGPEKVKQLITDIIDEVPDGLIDLARIPYRSAMGRIEDGLETGFYEYDYHVEDWKEEEITVIFGRNGEGKTTFISQIIAHCLERNQKTFLYSGEMSDDKIQDWLYLQMAGNNKNNLRTIITKYKDKLEPKPEIVKRMKEWHDGRLFVYDRNEREITGGLDKFFDVMEIASKRYNVKLFVIDNLMAILEENADSLYSDQANFVQRCKNFAITNKCHIVLLAHPNKEKQEMKYGNEGNLNKTDISGSNNIPNKADNIIAVERLWGTDADCDAIVTSLKDRTSGQRKQMKFFFSQKTLRFYNNMTKENQSCGWEKEPQEGFQLNIDADSPF